MADRILIVEDSETQAAQLADLLQQQGYQVDVQPDAQSALAALDEADVKPDLVISDVVMPEMDGFDFCSEIKQNKDLRKIPVLLVTNLHQPDEIIRGLECRCDAFLTKPYEPRKLIVRVNNLINLKDRDDPSKSGLRTKGVNLTFGGQTYYLDSNHQQILDLLISVLEETYLESQHMRSAAQEAQWMGHELRSIYSHFTGLANDHPDGIMITDRREIVQYVNEAASKMFGYSPEQLIGQSLDMGLVDGEVRYVTVAAENGEDVRATMGVGNMSWKGEDGYLVRLSPLAPEDDPKALPDSDAEAE